MPLMHDDTYDAMATVCRSIEDLAKAPRGESSRAAHSTVDCDLENSSTGNTSSGARQLKRIKLGDNDKLAEDQMLVSLIRRPKDLVEDEEEVLDGNDCAKNGICVPCYELA